MNTKIKSELFPKKEEIFSWIEDLSQWGHRKTGTIAGRKSAEYISDKMKEFGLDDVVIEEVPSMCMTVDNCKLNIDHENIECFYGNGTNRGGESGTFEFGIGDEQQEFLYLGDGNESDFKGVDVEGKIIVCNIRFPRADIGNIRKSLGETECFACEDQPSNGTKYNVFSPYNWPYNYFRALGGGAVGFVGILSDYYDDPYWYNEDYSDFGKPLGFDYMSIPALWVSRSSGKSLKTKLEEKGALLGHMQMKSTYEYKSALNISGKLKGESDDIILVHSHHDAVFSGSVQDGSGISEMLALAKYFSELPESERKKTMMFAALDTHYTDYEGHKGFIHRRQDVGDKLILDIAIEHIGKETYFDDSYIEHETGKVENRLIYITKQSGLVESVIDIFKKYDLRKSVFYPVDMKNDLDGEYEFSEDEVISDAYYFNEGGIPIVSMVSAQMYIYHPSDKPDRIPLNQLEPVGMAFAEIALNAAEIL